MQSINRLPIVFLLLIWSCFLSDCTRSNITFADYLKTLDTIPLPFEHACAGPLFIEISTHFDSAGFKKYKDADCARPLGILFNDNMNTVTVDLSNADYCVDPILTSFNKRGHKLDSLNLYGNSYTDTASSSMPYFKIDRDKTIIVIDTEKNWKFDTLSKIIPASVSTVIYSTTYYISKKGKFIKGARKKL